tara:strand:- start:1321 stop:1425 length:105 start_codon:yes stop_codon:yes gene_type:complete
MLDKVRPLILSLPIHIPERLVDAKETADADNAYA